MRILIIGFGSIAKKHLAALQSVLPKSEIFALRSNSDAEVVPGIKNLFSFDEVSGLIFDFAIVSNPTSEHKKTIFKLLVYNIPVFIEKPLHSSLDIEDLVKEIEKKNILTYVACNLRFLDCLNFVKDRLHFMRDKKLNEVNVYCGSYLPEWRPNMDFKKSYSANAALGGGVHIDLIHELDYLYWLFGTPIDVIRKFKSQSSLSISSVDYANYILDYNIFCAGIILNYYRRDTKRTLELVFDDETWEVDLLKNKVLANGQNIFSSSQRIADTYILQMQYFVNTAIVEKKSMNTVTDAYEVLKICLGK
jgi:predicted dehydrogenase